METTPAAQSSSPTIVDVEDAFCPSSGRTYTYAADNGRTLSEAPDTGRTLSEAPDTGRTLSEAPDTGRTLSEAPAQGSPSKAVARKPLVKSDDLIVQEEDDTQFPID